MNVAFFAFGALIALINVTDVLNTLMIGRQSEAAWWPRNRFYLTAWPAWRAVCRRIRDPRRRERWLAFFGPASLLGLLVLWTAGLVVGFGLIWWSLRGGFSAIGDLPDALYLSGVVFFTVGFGEIVPTSDVARVLTLVQAFVGVGVTSLIIGFLPNLFASYSHRERQLTKLDDFGHDRIDPGTLIRSLLGEDGDLARLEAFFAEWEDWAADVLDSHSTYPMLTMFRSLHPGQNWVTAMGVMTDAAVAVVAGIQGTEHGPAARFYRRSSRVFQEVARRVQVENAPDPTTKEMFLAGQVFMRERYPDLPYRDRDEAWRRAMAMRATYSAIMEGLIDSLLAPRGFWNYDVGDGLSDVVPLTTDDLDRLKAANDARPTALGGD